MIYDSLPWKRDLAQRATRLERRKTQRAMREASLAAIEHDVFLAAYATRKLIEAKKISDEVASMVLRASAFKPRGVTVDVQNWDALDRLYDLDSSATLDVKLGHWCNQLIHSFVFVLELDASRVAGFFVASDHEKDSRLLHFSLDVVVDAIRRVANDEIVALSWGRDAAGIMRVASVSNRERRSSR